MLNALNDIAANLNTWQIIDPANTNNIISEQHTADEKKKIMAQAVGVREGRELEPDHLVMAKRKAARKKPRRTG